MCLLSSFWAVDLITRLQLVLVRGYQGFTFSQALYCPFSNQESRICIFRNPNLWKCLCRCETYVQVELFVLGSPELNKVFLQDVYVWMVRKRFPPNSQQTYQRDQYRCKRRISDSHPFLTKKNGILKRLVTIFIIIWVINIPWDFHNLQQGTNIDSALWKRTNTDLLYCNS